MKDKEKEDQGKKKRNAEDEEEPVTSTSRPPPAKRITRSVAAASRRATRSGAEFGVGDKRDPLHRNNRFTVYEKRQRMMSEKEKRAAAAELDALAAAASGGGASSSSKPGKIIVIERCNNNRLFKTRSIQVIKGLKEKLPDITVQLNPKKPRKGCFEVREGEEGGQKFCTLKNLRSHPYKGLADLDVERLIAEIIAKINGEGTCKKQDPIKKEDPDADDKGAAAALQKLTING